MKIEEFISLYQKWGYPIKKKGEYYFYSYKLRNYSFPHFKKIIVDNKLVRALKWKYIMSTLLIDSAKKNECEFILSTNNYDIQNFNTKTRNRIKKSLQTCTFKRPSLDDMFHFGLLINQQTVKRQSRKEKTLTDTKQWHEYIKSVYLNNEFKILGAYYNNRMVGYTVIYELEGRYNFLHAYIDREDSTATSPMCGLLYTQINQLIEENGRITVSYGLGSFAHLPELIRFKRNMLFNQVPASRGYIIHPLLLIFIKLIICYNIQLRKQKSVKYSLIKIIIQLYQGNRLLEAELNKKI